MTTMHHAMCWMKISMFDIFYNFELLLQYLKYVGELAISFWNSDQQNRNWPVAGGYCFQF